MRMSQNLREENLLRRGSYANLQNIQEIIKLGECLLNLSTRKALGTLVGSQWSDEGGSWTSVE